MLKMLFEIIAQWQTIRTNIVSGMRKKLLELAHVSRQQERK